MDLINERKIEHIKISMISLNVIYISALYKLSNIYYLLFKWVTFLKCSLKFLHLLYSWAKADQKEEVEE